MKRILITFLIAICVAGTLTWASYQRGSSYENDAARMVVLAQANDTSKCPLSREQFASESVDLLSICTTYGLEAYVAARNYPRIADRIFNLYGEEAVLRDSVRRYGGDILPIVVLFMDHGSVVFTGEQTLIDRWRELVSRKVPQLKFSKLTPEQFGLMSLYVIEERGHAFLEEFEIVDGVARFKLGTGTMLEIASFFFGGAAHLDTILTRGERDPTWKELALAAIDVGPVGLAGRAVTLVKRTEKLEKSAARCDRIASVRRAGAKGLEAMTATRRMFVGIGSLALTYVAVTHPWLIASLGGWIAGLMGLNPLVGIFLVWFVISCIVIAIARKIAWWLWLPMRPILYAVRLGSRIRR